jgi:glycosyltransferase involved in cell wall biosynthesis
VRIAINAQVLPDNATGGVASVLIGLTSALGALEGPEEYLVIGPAQAPDWLRPYLGPNQRLVPGPRPRFDRAKALLGPVRPLARRLRRRAEGAVRGGSGVAVPVSDGFYEGLGCQVIHFAYQDFVVCRVPSVYNPHDLQHLHHPEFFTREILDWRAAFFSTGCTMAHTVVVASYWVRDDVIAHFEIPPEKVQVIPLAPPTQAYPEPSMKTLATVEAAYGLRTPFALYPAVTWPHKNHSRLLEALARLRDRDRLRVRLVCTGYQNESWPQIRRRTEELRLQDQVQFLGFVPPEHLRALYRLAQFVVVPTLFEAASGPLIEAWQDDVPVACSNVTSLPEQAGDAALIFDPLSVEAMAAAIAEMATNAQLREDLRRRGRRRLADFSWERSAKAYRAVYRRAAGHVLGEEDRWLLSWDWMRERRVDPSFVEPAR